MALLKGPIIGNLRIDGTERTDRTADPVMTTRKAAYLRNKEPDTVFIRHEIVGNSRLEEEDHETKRDRETESYKLAAAQLV
jgi:hypothetical protein